MTPCGQMYRDAVSLATVACSECLWFDASH